VVVPQHAVGFVDKTRGTRGKRKADKIVAPVSVQVPESLVLSAACLTVRCIRSKFDGRSFSQEGRDIDSRSDGIGVILLMTHSTLEIT